MKKRLKFIIALSAAVILLFSLSVGALASEDTALENTESEIADSESVYESENFFAVAFEVIKSHSVEIFSAMAFLGALLTAICYKRGLIPLLSKKLALLAEALKKISTENSASLERADAQSSETKEKIAALENSIELFADEISALAESLGSACELRREGEVQKKLLLAEIEMLKDIFTASALPEYQKEAICEKVKKIKEEISCHEEVTE